MFLCTFSYNIADPFPAGYPLPRHLPHHLFLPLHSFLLTPEHTLPSVLAVCPLNLATHRSYLDHTASLYFPSSSSFHPCVLSPHFSCLCQNEISSLPPPPANSIISSPGSKHYLTIPHLISHIWILFLSNKDAVQCLKDRPCRVAYWSLHGAYWYGLVIRWRNNGIYILRVVKAVKPEGHKVCVYLYTSHAHLCVCVHTHTLYVWVSAWSY